MDLSKPANEVVSVTSDEAHKAMDLLQLAMRRADPSFECELDHRFTPGLYTRTILMRAGDRIISKIHKTEHPYFILAGRARVFIDGVGWQELRAPHMGITKPGTRRVLEILEDTIWVTCHPTDKTTVAEVEADIIEPRDVLALVHGDRR